MSSWLLLALVVLVLVVVAQIAIVRFGERRIERRLAAGGGEAFVAIAAFPALRLLRQSGDRLRVRGRRLEIGMSEGGGGHGLRALDGFHEVDVVLGEFRTGPFEVGAFELKRVGRGPYRMRSRAHTTGAALASFGGEQIGGVAPVIGLLARQTPLGARAFAVEVEVELVTREGSISVGSGAGTIAGYPAGPLATAIAAAVARRLELGG